MLTTAHHAMTAAPPSPSSPRLVLAPIRASRAVLDGGWWPRSWDPATELPELVLALAARYGPIRQLMLNNATWDSRFKRLTVGDGVVRMGWFASLDPGVLIATTYGSDQIDLLVVPPRTAAAAATKAMAEAADPADLRRAPAILATMPEAPAPDPAEGANEQPVWDNEGGHTVEPGPRRPNHHLSMSS